MSEALKIELLDLRPEGTAKIRLWYHKWRETRPDQPYIDVELKMRKWRCCSRLVGKLVADGGISPDDLVEIARQLKQMGLLGFQLEGTTLRFTSKFLWTAIMKFGVSALNYIEPLKVEYVGGLTFNVAGHAVEFRRGVARILKGRKILRSYRAKLRLSSTNEVLYVFAVLRTQGVRAIPAGRSVYFNVDSLVGLMAITGATPPGFELLYSSEDFRIYLERNLDEYYYFAIRYNDVWRAAWGKLTYAGIMLRSNDVTVIEAIWNKIVGVGNNIEVPKISPSRRTLVLSVQHLKLLLGGRLESPESVEVSAHGGVLRVRTKGVGALIPFDPANNKGSVHVLVDRSQASKALEALLELGLMATITQDGIKLHRSSLWALLAMATKDVDPPAEVLPNVYLLYRHVDGERALHTFFVDLDDGRLCFAVKAGHRWRGSCGKIRSHEVLFTRATAVADAINSIYRKMGISREVRQNGDRVILSSLDLKLLGIWQPFVKIKLDKLQRELFEQI